MTAYHDTHIPYLATFGVDVVFLIPFVVFAIILGQPLSITTCSDLPVNASHVALPISSLAGQPVSYVVFSGAGQTTCYELMAVWGLMIALCILFAVSSISALFLFLGKRRGGGGGPSSLMCGPPGAGTFPGGGGYPMNDSQIEMAPGKGSFSRSPSIGSNGGGSFPGSPMGGPPMSAAGSFDGPPPPRGPPSNFSSPRGSFDSRPGSPGGPSSSRGSFDDGPLSPPPRPGPPRR
jgi:hypothetical protein